MYYMVVKTQAYECCLNEETSDTLSSASEIFGKVAEWLGLGEKEVKIFLKSHSSLSLDDFVEVLLSDSALAECKPPGEISCIYLRVEVADELKPRLQNCFFKLMLSRYKY
ncbi:hypothetical protein GGH92_006907 [Coemansia sp. RSA 2673]|nr:hypothetical protein GGH92_006907 [Coemansia sp. RSA 2673]